MIKQVGQEDIPACVKVIRESFQTVADTFGFTKENAPGFTAFAITEEQLQQHLMTEHRMMCAYWLDGKIVGYSSIGIKKDDDKEVTNKQKGKNDLWST